MGTFKLKNSSLVVLSWTGLLLALSYSEGFQIVVPTTSKHSTASTRNTGLPTTAAAAAAATATTTRLYNIFGNLFGQQSQSTDEGNVNTGGGPAAAASSVFEIPTKSIKSKPLRFYSQLFLAGYQNTPVKGSWTLASNEEDDERLDLYYTDGSGMVSFSFDDTIRVNRKGQRPSLQYMLNESLLLHDFLDELEQIAFGTDDDSGDNSTVIDDEKRLLQFSDENKDILSKIREKLPARQEKS
ncbi:hypothetical protein FRACYDRAFT_234833 [Fragilariopsis cylindrus CCMP1102]|uniref:Uncharacterized protein n=1 Tax=Fragilariopsis cylindrus CCMP1102 TaxID=635003 RepID=A0A1E7FSW4_9STRA|nr:hypothetical protein FRACYDRAFT_234833 [Fragilariopsis cylindrus CCMP1102]|eukprot:OEU21207.1 hypothetical protein FRACYDRAFT_234833 [Fragilariopsis cylindrus CCMP1102]